MDFVASRADEKQKGWRNRVSQFLQKYSVTVFNPWFKPDVRGLHQYGCEDVKSGERIKERWTFQLDDCELYTSCEPCPMCLSAIYWARLRRVHYGNTCKDAARIGFDDDFLYREVALPISRRKIPMKQLLHDEALTAFAEWKIKTDKTPY